MGPTKSSWTLSQSSELWGQDTMSPFHSDVNSELERFVQSQRGRSREPGFLPDRLILCTDYCQVGILSRVREKSQAALPFSPLLDLECSLVKPERPSQGDKTKISNQFC